MIRSTNFGNLIVAILFFCGCAVSAQDKVLVFTKTEGFRHESIPAGIKMIKDLGDKNGFWEAVTTEDSIDFNTQNLKKYKAVVWCNTSGEDLLNADQRQAFEDYIKGGGGFVGIHAATDTYRSGSWPFYNELVGGIVQTDPNHTASDYEAVMTVVNEHPSVDFLDGPYTKIEEYYYWKTNGGYLYPDNIELLRVESTGNKAYDEPRPISWYKEYKGGRSFYTALGHNTSDYTGDPKFIKHVGEGIKYVMGLTMGIAEIKKPVALTLYPNPSSQKMILESATPLVSVRIMDIQGHEVKRILSNNQSFKRLTLNSSGLQSGVYFVIAQGEKETNTIKFVKR